MIQRLGASSMSFKGQAISSPRDTFNAVIQKNEEIQQAQIQELKPDAAQGQKLNVVA